ncbi:MAG: ATP-binding protein [Rubrivivax sp.]|nr:ATP-binding protein [Rubrivivax sp.]
MNITTLSNEAADKVLAEWVRSDETRHLEFKRVSGKMVAKALETICAFANADGGLLVLGLADQREHKGAARVFGVEENAEAVDELVRKLRTEFLPPMGGVQAFRLSCDLHNGPARGRRGHVMAVQVQRSAQVHSLVTGGT